MEEITKNNMNNRELDSNDENSDITEVTQSNKDAEGINSEKSKNKWFNYILQMFTAGASLLAMIAGFKKYTYSIYAENFYGIPHKYFENNLESELIFIIFFTAAIVFLILIPIILAYCHKKNVIRINKIDSIMYPIFLWFSFFIILYVLLYKTLNFEDTNTIILFIIAGILSVLLGVFSYKILIGFVDKENIEQKPNHEVCTSKNIVNAIFNKDSQNYFFIVIGILFIILYLIAKRFSYDPTERKQYEFFIDQDGKSKIIIDNYNEKAITMDYYKILNENKFAIRKNNFKIQNVGEKEIKLNYIEPVYNKEFSKLTLNLNDGKFNNSSGSLEYAVVQNYTISELEKLINDLFTDSKPSKNGHNLLYWSDTEDGEFNYFKDSKNKLLDISSDITLYAQYE